jgi:hypothetical protein
MYKLLILLIFLLQGCTYFVAKETIEVIDEALETSPNPEKKKKILEKQKIKKNKAKEFYCSKVKDEEKCGNG